MDSGNSGSLQSSSGGGGGGSDQEDDSRPFFNPLTHLGSTSSTVQHQQPPSFLLHHHHQHQQQPNFIDPSSFHAFSQSLQPNPNPLLHLDVIHSQPLRSDGLSHCEDPLSSMQLRSVHDSNVRSSAPSDQSNHNPVPRNPKKRARASRRAPTTVLTTDTSNFRAMVQEFTGIPAPPFTGTSYSRRLDLFGSVGSALRSGHLDAPLYPLRPSAHKVQQSPLLSSPSSLMLNSNMSNMQNQNILSFQSLLHQNPSPIHESGLASLDGMGNGSFSGGLTNQDQVRSSANFDGNYGSLNGCKLNFSASSTSDFLNEKGLVDNVVTTRGAAHEGTVDSWFCSSD
ncbi:putative protein TPRXL [Tripterygium wilfordii]|uniref:VQ domain-containing protein n=1 Tax=Tripterygium wilfordii TaxID=458696 RepID=A0A7J7D0G3_TRIWF|nr:uncharacterized protein LOC120010773 [Tripterygium wilfordii]KAF5739729.1 putative protein TPRXL [Tripterygium wilfordii]